MRGVPLGTALGAIVLCGCHPAPPRPGDGGPVVVWTSPADGERGVSRTPLLVVGFDRPLAPRSLPGTGVALRSGDAYWSIEVTFDPALRALEVRPTHPLDPDIDYRLEVMAPTDLDGTTGDEVAVEFSTGAAEVEVPLPSATYEDVAPTLAICAECHGGSEPTMGMDLSSPAGIAATALGVTAREVAAAGEPGPGALGLVGLMRIEPGRPDRSYLVYKVLGDPHIVGARMPYGRPPLEPEAIEALSRWIRAGAPLPSE